MGSRAAFNRFLPAVAGVLAFGGAAQAAELKAVEDNLVFRGDAAVVQGTAGASTSIQVKEATTAQGNARIAYLKFNLSSLTAGDGNFGTLTLTTTAVASPAAAFTLRAYGLNASPTDTAWSESTITFNTRPAASSDGANNFVSPTATTILGGSSVPVSAPTGTKFSFTFPELSSYKQADGTMTMIVLVTAQTDAGPSLSFASSENGTATLQPTLTTSLVPEPTSIALLGLSAAGLLGRRRK